MSSPADSGLANQGPKKHDDEQVTFQFCHECSNMLYPKEDKNARKLMYTCRTCQHTVEATSNCIYRNMLKSQVGDTAGVTQDVALDPTVGGPDATFNAPPFPTSSTIVMCLCCGDVVMCSDCESNPATVPDIVRPAAAATEPTTPPMSSQAEPKEQDWSATLDQLVKLGFEHNYFDEDADMDDWEEELGLTEDSDSPPNAFFKLPGGSVKA